MRTVSGAQGPLNCHGQSSGSHQEMWGHTGGFDTDHLRTKLVLLLERAGGGNCDHRKSLTGDKRNSDPKVSGKLVLDVVLDYVLNAF